MNGKFWANKRVLVTGHTGFKGSWLSIWLHHLGAKVIGYSLDPQTERDNFVLSRLSDKIIDIRGDIRDQDAVMKVFSEQKPEIVFHLAAQPLVRRSYTNPKETYETNVMGSLHILEAVGSCECVHTCVMVTTDKCYENREQIWGYRETDRLGGYDPYSSSKACAEILIGSYRNSYWSATDGARPPKVVASVRAGNVIGGGDWSADRILPDCIRALEAGHPIPIRNPEAVRPWQHVLEPLSGYLLLAEKTWEDPSRYGQGWNFGPEHTSLAPVREVARQVINLYGSGSLTEPPAQGQPHEAQLLCLDITKARQQLGWYPKWSLYDTLRHTVDWYKAYRETDIYALCLEQIRHFCQQP